MMSDKFRNFVGYNQERYFGSITGELRGRMLALDPEKRAAAKLEYAELEKRRAERAIRSEAMKVALAAKAALEAKQEAERQRIKRERRAKRKSPRKTAGLEANSAE